MGVHLILDMKLEKYNNILHNEKECIDFMKYIVNINNHTIMNKPIFVQFPSLNNTYKNILDDFDKFQITNNINNKELVDKYKDFYNKTKTSIYGGYTAFIVLAESHISIHTYPEELYIALDIYSCKNIDVKMNMCKIKDYLSNRLKIINPDVKYNIINRN